MGGTQRYVNEDIEISGILSNDDGDVNDNGKKGTLHVHHASLYISLLSLHDYCTTWKCLISSFLKDASTRQRLSFSIPELRCRSFLIQLQRKMPTFDELHEMYNWSSTNSLFKWRYRSRHGLCCLRGSNTALQCWNNAAAIRNNVVTMLQRGVALKIVVANRLV